MPFLKKYFGLLVPFILSVWSSLLHETFQYLISTDGQSLMVDHSDIFPKTYFVSWPIFFKNIIFYINYVFISWTELRNISGLTLIDKSFMYSSVSNFSISSSIEQFLARYPALRRSSMGGWPDIVKEKTNFLFLLFSTTFVDKNSFLNVYLPNFLSL